MTLPLQSAIEDSMTSTNLRSLDLEEIFDIPSCFIVLALSSLRRLGLHSITVKPSESHVPYPPALRTEEITLRTQYINVKSIVDLILPDIPRPGYLDKIRRLVLGIDDEIHPESPRLIAATASTLRRLELRCGGLLSFKCLSTFPVFLFCGPAATPVPRRCGLSTTIPTLEVLRLTFGFALPDEEDWGPDRAGPLPLFDVACAYRAKLPSLRRVHCRGWSDLPVDQEDYAAFHPTLIEDMAGATYTGAGVYCHLYRACDAMERVVRGAWSWVENTGCEPQITYPLCAPHSPAAHAHAFEPRAPAPSPVLSCPVRVRVWMRWDGTVGSVDGPENIIQRHSFPFVCALLRPSRAWIGWMHPRQTKDAASTLLRRLVHSLPSSTTIPACSAPESSFKLSDTRIPKTKPKASQLG
ncbi:hypothetical protein B0H14DRAFT_3490370 [Mycena olivaceomarginata]|nr:hypothetical protein B0H14DRAFT_3490370 [Mycena olivaceomarginata]